jgi:beta-phosphoglucomutase-like phosphatase (HAD superfamily)
MAKWMLQSAGVYEYIDAFAFGDEVIRSKPEPEIFIKAANALGLDPEECVVLEDSGPGVIAGKAAGGYVVHIPDMVILPEEVKKGIAKEVESLHDVITWIEKMK